jgi:uncharacterized protein YbjT (DUF2867 family)
MRIAVAGGTGVVGRHTVEAVRAAGHEAVVLARSTGVDLTTGTGLVEALTGADTVIDAANVVTNSRRKSVAYFDVATRNLIAAATRTGTRHIVALSIIGIDRVPLAYYAGKQRQEQLLAQAGVPYSILRASQFHEFAGQVLDRVPGPIALVPKMRTQPVAAAEVGQLLATLATGAPTPMTQLAGPQEEQLPALARRLLHARGSHRPIWSPTLPAKGGKEMATGGNLPTGDYRRGTQTFDEWLQGGGATR